MPAYLSNLLLFLRPGYTILNSVSSVVTIKRIGNSDSGPGFMHAQQVRLHMAQNSEGPKKLLSSVVSLNNMHQ